ncbi:MAG: tetratricopeptide repeat protein [Treponema sp.]
MPNLNEIAEFRRELKNIAQEERITSNWKEPVYDELPPPDPAAVPDLDIDALLSSTGLTAPSEEESGQSMTFDDPSAGGNGSFDDAGTAEDGFSNFDTVPVADAVEDIADNDMLTGFDDLFSGIDSGSNDAGTDDSAGFDDFLSSLDFDDAPETAPENEGIPENSDFGFDENPDLDIPDVSGFDIPDFGTDAPDLDYPASSSADEELPELGFDDSSIADEGQVETDGFDDMLSSFDFDSGTADEEVDSSAPDLSAFDFSSFDSPSDDVDSDTTDEAADEDVFEDADGPVRSGVSDSETEMPDFSGLEELSLFSEDRSEFDEEPADEEPKDAEQAEEASFSDNFDGGSADPSDTLTDSADSVAGFDDAASFSDTDTGFEGMSGFSMPGDMSDSFFTQQDDDQSGFSLEENVLDTAIPEVTDDQFNLPDNFKDFSADSHARMFDSVIAKSTGVASETSSLTITDEEYFQFLNRLESFPLNVQLAIQDYIGNGDDTDENKMDFVRLILSKASLKKIAHRLEKILNTSIPIPRGFQRKSVEEYEQEKKTFKYWVLHRFLPVAVMTGIALIMVFCISVLSWQFIYKPVKSESLYKTGYVYLENGQYETAVEKFNKAGEYKRKKKWYFAYARAFRNKKQFTSAEKIYTRLIYDFNHDKQASLEYADMLSTDLRNYEKAEFVLRRRLLDEHINDKEGLLALGDVYMNWADEDAEKYDAAVKIYSRLIELYGENDTFLVRMMRYFIRTDNLAEVLVLKERFLPRLSKIEPADITELSGYLLEKRYNPKPLDSEKLRMQIDDVRMLLEKAVQADKTMPEAYYNLGRFFIYNHKQDAAIENLTEAIKRFETAAPMTARRTINYVDALRLLGEQLAAQKKYLDAQKLYADALNIYREYTAFKPLPPNKIIGKLYADYGDIDYFISYNFDSALDSYQNAVKELYSTPSIHYRIGYIHYQQEQYPQAIEAMSIAYAEKPNDKNVLFGFGNVLFKRGDYFAAQASYEQLMELLDAQRVRKGKLFPHIRPDDAVFIERYMHTANNLGATLNRLSERTGDSQKNARALALFAESTRAWDALTRNPQTMIRSKSVGLAYLNIQNMINPRSAYHAEIYTDIPMILDNEKVLEQKEDK